jgi:hypothetical protein
MTHTTWTEAKSTWNCARDDNLDGSCDVAWTGGGAEGDYGADIVDSEAPASAGNWNSFGLVGTDAENAMSITWGSEVYMLIRDESQSSAEARYVNWYSKEATGTANDPYIQITYSAAAAAAAANEDIIIFDE